ncbi:hypothetical protein Patl1_07727 [Pistacia atlantica]|uniref:Uncharacterized protein n=1 Tax=Pistacia atlantica TaxID=434234 RepID=A0ACC1AHJ7_9ROSI|nr:hypothetical protein Patl1_07727 [Pistacia atlantica]
MHALFFKPPTTSPSCFLAPSCNSFLYSFKPHKRFHFLKPCSSLKQTKKQQTLQKRNAPQSLKWLLSPKSGGGDDDEDKGKGEGLESDAALKGTLLAGVLLVGVVGGFGTVGFIYKDQINAFLNQFSGFIEDSLPFACHGLGALTRSLRKLKYQNGHENFLVNFNTPLPEKNFVMALLDMLCLWQCMQVWRYAFGKVWDSGFCCSFGLLFIINIQYRAENQFVHHGLVTLTCYVIRTMVIVQYIAEILAIPAIPLTMSAGLLFGSVIGTIIVSISGTVAASVAFLIARYFARDRILKLVEGNKKFLAIDKAIGENGFKVVTLLRLSPLLPFSLGNYLYGLTSVKFVPYVLGSWLGMLPGTWAYVSAGAFGRAIIQEESEIAIGGGGGNGQLLTLGLGLLFTALAAAYVTRLAKDAVKDIDPSSSSLLVSPPPVLSSQTRRLPLPSPLSKTPVVAAALSSLQQLKILVVRRDDSFLNCQAANVRFCRVLALAKPDVGKLIIATVALLIASLSSILIPKFGGKIIDIVSGDIGTPEQQAAALNAKFELLFSVLEPLFLLFFNNSSVCVETTMTEVMLDTAKEEFLKNNFKDAYRWALSAKLVDPFFEYVDRYVEMSCFLVNPSLIGYVKIGKMINPDEFICVAAPGAMKLITTAWEIVGEDKNRSNYHVRAGFKLLESSDYWPKPPLMKQKSLVAVEQLRDHHGNALSMGF